MFKSFALAVATLAATAALSSQDANAWQQGYGYRGSSHAYSGHAYRPTHQYRAHSYGHTTHQGHGYRAAHGYGHAYTYQYAQPQYVKPHHIAPTYAAPVYVRPQVQYYVVQRGYGAGHAYQPKVANPYQATQRLAAVPAPQQTAPAVQPEPTAAPTTVDPTTQDPTQQEPTTQEPPK